jgi:acyl transferase domain-containing protein
MDPQQRLILETTFRAIEDAGIRLDQLAGTRVAVIVGCSTQEYNAIQITASERERIGPSTNPASALSIVSNRVSYLFDLRGPSFTVDTACSSSLTAVHLACRAIWDESADAALVGGVNAVLRPETTMGFSKGSYLSPDGECRAFSDDANGYVRSEGCGVVFLKPLADAVANGDRIYALIRGSWINQDGRTRGMTLPSREAQEALLERAYRDANVDPSQVCFIEAHGTGTPAGDPIEAAAIGSVVGRHRPESGSCLIGSIKTNIGHLESAAGMAGIIKLALTMQTRVVFPNRNFRAPNPAIPFEQLRLRVPTEVAQLGDGPLYGGVNAFGFGGANAHIVLESPPSIAPALASTPTDQDGQLHTLLFSARSKSSLQATAKNLADVLERQSVPPADLAAQGSSIALLCEAPAAFSLPMNFGVFPKLANPPIRL